jgi:hypothetical protein
VNLLLHRAFARRELGDPASGFGAMLPDLVRMVDRRWRPRPGAIARDPASPVLLRVLDGIDHHLAIDLWFHRRPELHDGERITADALRAAGTTARRLPLFAHALWEMLLDGAWARRAGPTAVEESLRAECVALAPVAEEAMALHGGDAAPWAASPEHLARLWRTVPVLASGYATAEGLAARLDGLRASFGLGRADAGELARWHAALGALEPLADAALIALEEARCSSLPHEAGGSISA